MLNSFNSAFKPEGQVRGVKRLIIFVGAALFPLLAFAQAGQRMRDRDPDLEGSKKLAAELQQANFHYGPFYLLSRIRISDAGFSETASLPTGDQQGVISLSVDAPQRFYFVPTRKSVVTVELTPGYSFFRGQGREGQFNYMARGDVHFLFNHLYLDVYGLREDQLRAFVADINRLATSRTDEAGVLGEIKYSSKTSALFNLRFRDTEFPESRFQPLDRDLSELDRQEQNARLSLMHKTFPLTSLFVAGERSNYTFDNDVTRDSTRTFFGGGAIYNSGRFTMRIEGGPARLEFDDPIHEDFSGMTAAFEATRSAGRRTLTVNLDRDLGFSIFGPNDYYISNIARVALSHVATRRLTLRTGTTFERDDYDVPVGGVKRRDNISFSYIGFLYNIRRFNLGADVGWHQRASNLGIEEDAGIRMVLHLSFTP
jgi:Putative beta-barrel porin 2